MDKFIERLVPELLGPQRHERVLDIGCGTGNHLLFLNKLGLDINGVDASPYMIDIARKRLGDRCVLKTGMAEDLPFDDNEFDLAVLINSLEFLDDPLKALREAGRVANKQVFIVVMNTLSWNCVCDKLQGLFRETLSKHIRPYSLWELKSYLQLAFGHAPITWRSEQGWPLFVDKICGILPDTWKLSRWPFGSFLGLTVKIEYRVKTDNLPLKLRVNKREQSIAGGITTMGNLKRDYPTQKYKISR
ncbi:class I SAM-dependent methyltransferase [Thermodesulfobacteriota bacterium]